MVTENRSMNASPKLTDLGCRNVKCPPKGIVMMSDGGGLRLELHANGGKYWSAKIKGKPYRLGPFPKVGVAQARIMRDDYRKLIADNKDPKSIKPIAKLAGKGSTFEDVARQWHALRVNDWTPTLHGEVLRRMENHLFPEIGKRSFPSITYSDMLAVMEKIDARGTLTVREKVFEYALRVFAFAIPKYIDHSPIWPRCFRDKLVKVPDEEPQPHVAADAIPALLQDIDTYPVEQTRLALNLAALTVVRSNELSGAQWKEFNGGNVWTIPASRCKGRAGGKGRLAGVPHKVPLSRQALAVLDKLGRGQPDAFLFPSPDDDGKPMTRSCMTRALSNLGYGVKQADGTLTSLDHRQSAHGFRHQFRELMIDAGADVQAVEHCLSHVEPGIAGVYGQPQRLVQRAKVLQDWANVLDELRATPHE
jgi:integrase